MIRFPQYIRAVFLKRQVGCFRGKRLPYGEELSENEALPWSPSVFLITINNDLTPVLLGEMAIESTISLSEHLILPPGAWAALQISTDAVKGHSEAVPECHR